ncbi:MAG: glycosyltransferase family 2 protein [Halobacteriaceae archaeon]
MDLSVVVPTLDSREQLAGCLEALGENAATAEVIVVNGPSTDGTSGLARSAPVVDCLVEVAERNINAARNAGIAAASGDIIAFVGQDSEIEPGWHDAIATAIDDGASVVTGPVHRAVSGGVTTETPEETTINHRDITYVDGGNVAFTRTAIEAVDGFDEYLETGGARDVSHRLAGLGHEVVWEPGLAVLRTDGDDVQARTANGERNALALKYLSLGYRLVKNYGVRPGVIYRLGRHTVTDGLAALRSVVTGDRNATTWIEDGRTVVTALVAGVRDGLGARRSDPTAQHNPNGVSTRTNRAVAVYDC